MRDRLRTSVPKPRILVIDDEPSIVKLVTPYLEREGLEVHTASDGPSGLKSVRTLRPDLVVLDIMLPGLDGLELLTQLRKESDVYVILLTARTEESDRVVGLTVGADDYVTKPFSPRELAARVKAALRRMRGAAGARAGDVLIFRRVRIDAGSRQVWMDDRPVELTPIEFDLLRTLAEHPGLVLTRDQLLERVWGYDYSGEARVVDVHIGHIRQKLGDEGTIVTVRGVGYRFADERD